MKSAFIVKEIGPHVASCEPATKKKKQQKEGSQRKAAGRYRYADTEQMVAKCPAEAREVVATQDTQEHKKRRKATGCARPRLTLLAVPA
jgi:hypothetical protein